MNWSEDKWIAALAACVSIIGVIVSANANILSRSLAEGQQAFEVEIAKKAELVSLTQARVATCLELSQHYLTQHNLNQDAGHNEQDRWLEVQEIGDYPVKKNEKGNVLMSKNYQRYVAASTQGRALALCFSDDRGLEECVQRVNNEKGTDDWPRAVVDFIGTSADGVHKGKIIRVC